MQLAVFTLVFDLNFRLKTAYSPNRNEIKRKSMVIIVACHSDNRRRWTTGGFTENEWEMLHFCRSAGFKSRLSNHKNSQSGAVAEGGK